MKLDILAVGVHPDDVELSACGVLLQHISLGHKVGVLDLTRGELGTRGTAETRDKEADAAGKLMGLSVRANLGMEDGFFQYTQENMLAIARIIRLFQPEIVLANAVEDRHPDHGRAAKLTADACFYAGLRKVETVWENEPQMAWRPKAVYHYIQDMPLKPDFVVDITPYLDKKLEVIKQYKTQFFDPGSTEPITPISGADFLESVIAKARLQGRPAGFEFGEGFTVNRTPGVRGLFDLV